MRSRLPGGFLPPPARLRLPPRHLLLLPRRLQLRRCGLQLRRCELQLVEVCASGVAAPVAACVPGRVAGHPLGREAQGAGVVQQRRVEGAAAGAGRVVQPAAEAPWGCQLSRFVPGARGPGGIGAARRSPLTPSRRRSGRVALPRALLLLLLRTTVVVVLMHTRQPPPGRLAAARVALPCRLPAPQCHLRRLLLLLPPPCHGPKGAVLAAPACTPSTVFPIPAPAAVSTCTTGISPPSAGLGLRHGGWPTVVMRSQAHSICMPACRSPRPPALAPATPPVLLCMSSLQTRMHSVC